MYFFFFILKLYTAAQFTTERDESHARLVLSCLNSFLLSPFQRVDLGQITPLNLLPLPLISDSFDGVWIKVYLYWRCVYLLAQSNWFC